jgi:hypothetical protein
MEKQWVILQEQQNKWFSMIPAITEQMITAALNRGIMNITPSRT